MTVLLSPFGAFLKEDRLSPETLERQSLMNSHQQSWWISFDLMIVHDRHLFGGACPPEPDLRTCSRLDVCVYDLRRGACRGVPGHGTRSETTIGSLRRTRN